MQQCIVTYFLHLCSIASVHRIINIGLNENHSTPTSRVEGKSSVCAISMKYRKMILIIIIISLGQIILSYIANTSRTHARTPAYTLVHTHSPTHHRRCSMTELTPPSRLTECEHVHAFLLLHTHKFKPLYVTFRRRENCGCLTLTDHVTRGILPPGTRLLTTFGHR